MTTTKEALKAAPEFASVFARRFLILVIASEAKQSSIACSALDCFVAEPVIGRAFARPVGSSQ
ncbi:MAG TPA: hypothetical protein VNS33_06530 [Bradyrhizobium sp.]|nr:hypothetical protein [Bradyrhizobium sp.]